tara:strand:- start:137 stop:331 length:195 start_codon:yes stop_codon:yes gene_type:complete
MLGRYCHQKKGLVMKKENEELRESLRTALILWEQGGQELLERIINGGESALEDWKKEQEQKNEA